MPLEFRTELLGEFAERQAAQKRLFVFAIAAAIVARNGIVLISHYQHLEQFEGEPFGPGLVIRGARERVVPIMMTVFNTGLVLIPLIAAGQIPSNEIEHPMAIVILGGLITATLLNLFVVPCSTCTSPRAGAGRVRGRHTRDRLMTAEGGSLGSPRSARASGASSRAKGTRCVELAPP